MVIAVRQIPMVACNQWLFAIFTVTPQFVGLSMIFAAIPRSSRGDSAAYGYGFHQVKIDFFCQASGLWFQHADSGCGDKARVADVYIVRARVYRQRVGTVVQINVFQPVVSIWS